MIVFVGDRFESNGQSSSGKTTMLTVGSMCLISSLNLLSEKESSQK